MDRRNWMKEFAKFMKDHEILLSRRPTVCRKQIDIFKFFTCVKDRGGFKKVNRVKDWREIAKSLGINIVVGTVPELKKFYKNYLLLFEYHLEFINYCCTLYRNKEHADSTNDQSQKAVKSSQALTLDSKSTREENSLLIPPCKGKVGKTMPGTSKGKQLRLQYDSECSKFDNRPSQGMDLLNKPEEKRKYNKISTSSLEHSIKQKENEQDLNKTFLDKSQQTSDSLISDKIKLGSPTVKPSNANINLFNPNQPCHHNQKPELENSNIHFPVHQDVNLKKLPFFDVLDELVKPSSLVSVGSQRYQENIFEFQFTSQQAMSIASSQDLTKMHYPIQVLMRICLLNKTCEQDDFFPPGLFIEVNEEILQLPSMIVTNNPHEEPKRPSQPLNITPLVKLNPNVVNHISISWSTKTGSNFVVTVHLVRKLIFSELLQRLQSKEVRHSQITRNRIQEKFGADSDHGIATTCFRLSLVCPLGKIRMVTPCQTSTCQHIQCFDAVMFLKMNEKKQTWRCPICDTGALFDDLVVDGYFQKIINSKRLPPGVKEIQVQSNGSWVPIKKTLSSPPQKMESLAENESESDDAGGSDGKLAFKIESMIKIH